MSILTNAVEIVEIEQLCSTQATASWPNLNQILYGGDYNPEQWPEETWHEDVKLMQAAGINLVSLGIFSWGLLEPHPGHYNFEWLDHIMDLLDEHGIKVDLATATASPPAWLARLHPESLPVTHDGSRLWPGSRQQYCPSSLAYRQATSQLVWQLANRYKNHPALVMWHVGNEYACHVAQCFCNNSAIAFREWLKQRYASLERLNEVWGTAFWSQHYSEWEEIQPPRLMPTFVNPSQQLDWQRFSSDAILECFEMERAILKEVTPELPITTNFLNSLKSLDYWKWAAHEDLVSLDCYPDPVDPLSVVDAALNYDLIRSLGGGRPWLLMEQTTSQVNWRSVNPPKKPGQMRAWSYQALAHGANGLMFFQWRASKAGAEKFHGALVPHIGTENSRVWREVKALGHELKGLTALLNTRVQAEVAIMFDWENWWALELEAKPSIHLKMLEQLHTYYEPLYRKNIMIDFVPPWGDLTSYKVVLVPNLYLVRETDQVAQRLEDFVAGGGRLVMSFFSGIVDENEHIRLGGYPAPFRHLLGLWVEEFDPYVPGRTTFLQLDGLTQVYSSSCWADVIHLEGAEPLATYAEGIYSGKPAITRYSYGEGYSYYLGTRPELTLMEYLLEQVCQTANLPSLVLQAPLGVEVSRRQTATKEYYFVINHNDFQIQMQISRLENGEAQELLTGQSLDKADLKLEPFGVAILSVEKG
jgi:beta-galactosidase